MAGAALSYALRKLDVLITKGHQLLNVGNEARQLQNELQLMLGLLNDVYPKRKRKGALEVWVKQVKDMAYEIEDVLDTFNVEIDENQPSGSTSAVQRIFRHPRGVVNISDRFKKLTEDLNKLYKRKGELGITSPSDTGSQGETQLQRASKISDFDDSEIVGFENEKNDIIRRLKQCNEERMVLSIVGLGGLGKTTLAQKVFKSSQLEKSFTCQAWVSISQEFNENNIFREIFHSVNPTTKNMDPPMKDEDLPMKLKDYLEDKRYLIILDDVWKIDHWERLQRVLRGNKKSSRIIITTRFTDIATEADRNTEPYNLRFLEDDECVALLYRKVFGRDIDTNNFRPDLQPAAYKLIKKCGQLPLAVVVLGGILRTKQDNYTTWNEYWKTMTWHDSDKEKCCTNILAMSYHDLPYNLKDLFLYFAAFPEDHRISAKHITRMWVAERMIQTDESPSTMEYRAEDCLQEFVQRCLVQVVQKSWTGNCKLCVMHDLLRDFAIHEAQDYNFFTKQEKLAQNTEPRRTTLQISPGENVPPVNGEKTRSICSFGKYMLKVNYSEFRLLRVLNIERVDFKEQGKWQLENLSHLRYLGIRYCHGDDLFDHVRLDSFENLETLDCKQTMIRLAKKNKSYIIPHIPTLRHVTVGIMSAICCSKEWNVKNDLQTLKWFELDQILSLNTTNIRTIGICNTGKKRRTVRENWNTINDVLRHSKELKTLLIKITGPSCPLPFTDRGTRDLPCHRSIECLLLKGTWDKKLCVPSFDMFPPNLAKLTLEESKLEQDPLHILKILNGLRILRLRLRSYVGESLTCPTDGFQRLETLELRELQNLHRLDIMEGAMPKLCNFHILQCYKLKEIPKDKRLKIIQNFSINRAYS